jgi:hypothetical protein
VRKWIVIAAVLGLGAFYYFSSPPGDKSFVHGEWTRTTTGNQGNVVSKIVFNSDNTAVFMNENGDVYSNCNYSFHNKSEIDCECTVNNKKAVLTLKLDGKTKIENSFGDVYEKK